MAKIKQEMVFIFLLLAQLGWHGRSLAAVYTGHIASYLLPAAALNQCGNCKGAGRLLRNCDQGKCT